MDIEQTRKILDLRQKILANEAAGRAAADGISPEELAEGLAALRQNRVIAGSKGGTATAKKKTAAKKSANPTDRAALAAKLGIDLDE